ncbi:MAG TPA: prealbumin-like fold domain-containing protein, partial [Pirellulales bacterium]
MKRSYFGRGLSLVDLIRRSPGSRVNRRDRVRSARLTQRRRTLWFEECESRNLLAATISGFKFATATATGFTPGSDLPMAGVTINLYQDNGDLTFNPAMEALVQHVVTGANGSYAFNNVADGHYFINETPPAGFSQSAGPAFYTVDVIGGLVYTTPANDPTTTLNVDDFSAPDPAATYFINALDPNPLFRQDSSAAGQLPILGTQRDLLVNVLGPANPISANGFVGTVSMNNGVFNLGSATNGPGTEVTMQYDGVDADSAALNNAMGLNANLSANGGAGIRLDFDFLQVGTGTTMDMEIAATSSGGSATFTGQITQNPGGFSVFVPFSSLTTSGAFDLAHVTSLQVSFNAAGVQDVDYEITQIAIAGFNFGNFAVSKRLFLTPAGPATVTSSFGGATFSFNSGSGRMDVDGTSGNDVISIVPNNKNIAVVTVNGHVLSNTIPLASIQQIGISAGDGSDTVTLTNIVKPVLFDGGAG